MRDAATHKPKFTKLAKVADSQSPIVYGIVQPGPDIPDGVIFVQSRDVGGKISLGALNRTSPEIAVTSRQVVRLFLEQLWLEFAPVLHRLQGRLAALGRSRSAALVHLADGVRRP
jgi:hypothetical protein